jgi:hypothetical protein
MMTTTAQPPNRKQVCAIDFLTQEEVRRPFYAIKDSRHES